MSASPARRPDRAALVIAVLLAALGAVLLHGAASLPQDGGYAGIGPADAPRMVGWALVALALWTLVEGLRNPAAPPDRQETGPVLWIIAGLVGQLALMGVAGFSIATGLLFACAARAFGRPKLWFTFPIGIVFCLGVFGVFDGLLSLRLPTGPLETLVFGG